MKRKEQLRSIIPQLNLKGEEFAKMVPPGQKLDLTVQFKYKARKEGYDDVYAFALQGDQFKIILRNAQEYIYTFNAKDLKTVYMHQSFDPEYGDVNEIDKGENENV